MMKGAKDDTHKKGTVVVKDREDTIGTIGLDHE
jgi:hypothetical protein